MPTLFLTCAAVGGVVLIAQFLLSALGVGHHDIPAHDGSALDAGHNAGHAGHAHGDSSMEHASAGLELLSVRALSAAVAFFGIGGLGATAMGWPRLLAFPAGAALGLVSMFGVAYMMRAMLGMEQDRSVNIRRAVGEPATVYVPVPGALAGMGKVLLTLKGRTVEYEAVTSDANALPTGMNVVVVDVRDDGTVEVVPLPTLDGVS